MEASWQVIMNYLTYCFYTGQSGEYDSLTKSDRIKVWL